MSAAIADAPAHAHTRQHVKYERRGHAAWITLNRPNMRNAMDITTMFEVASALREASRDAEARVVVLTGEGDNFCGGGDVSVVKTPDDYVSFTASFAEVDDAITGLKKPLITRIRGRCTAGGFAMTVASDIAIALDDAVFGTPEITHGMFPLMAMGMIEHDIGHKACWKMFASGELFGTAEALRIGCITEEVHSPEELDARVDWWVERISGALPAAIMVGRDLFYELRTRTREQAVRLGGKAVIRLLELRQAPPPPADYLRE